jgi:hypothetical protein
MVVEAPVPLPFCGVMVKTVDGKVVVGIPLITQVD